VLEAQCNTITREAHAEIGLLKERVTSTEKELELERRRVHELQEMHKANAKAYSKLKAQYDKAKQRALLQPGDGASFPAAGVRGGVGGTPSVTPRGGSSARQTFVPGLQHPGHHQQHRPTSSLSQHHSGSGGSGGWTPQGQPQGAVPFARSGLSHAQQQQASRGRRALLPEQQASAFSGLGGAGRPRLSNATAGAAGGRRSGSGEGSAQQQTSGAFGMMHGGGGGGGATTTSGFLGQSAVAGGGGGRGASSPPRPLIPPFLTPMALSKRLSPRPAALEAGIVRCDPFNLLLDFERGRASGTFSVRLLLLAAGTLFECRLCEW